MSYQPILAIWFLIKIKEMLSRLLLILCLCNLNVKLEAQTDFCVLGNNQSVPVSKGGDNHEGLFDGEYYALIIAAQDYSKSWLSDLSFPIPQAKKLRRILKENYYFDSTRIFLLENPGYKDIRTRIKILQNLLQKQDKLLIYYAGHGIWEEKKKRGYWALPEAEKDNPSTWISNERFLEQCIKPLLKVNDLLVIVDACFGGSIVESRTRGGVLGEKSEIVQEYELTKSRMAMTSAPLIEVPDDSKFSSELISYLENNEALFMDALTVFTSIRERVFNLTNLLPQYNRLVNTGHEGGEFIFVRKK